VKQRFVVMFAMLLALIPIGIEVVPLASARVAAAGRVKPAVKPGKCRRASSGHGKHRRAAAGRGRGCAKPVRDAAGLFRPEDAEPAAIELPAAGAGPVLPAPAPSQPIGSKPNPVPDPQPLQPTPPQPVPASAEAPERFFSPTSFWNTPVPADAPLDPGSEQVVDALARQVGLERAAKKGPAIITSEYSVPIYTVAADQPPVEVQLQSPYVATALRDAWKAVPLPPSAEAARGRDRHLVVWQPSSDRLWEFWHLAGGPGTWAAEWGGAIDGVSGSSGAYGPDAWPGASPTWGASASSLSIAGGLITLRDLERGQIDHALAMSLRDVRAGLFLLPARRSDGESGDPLSLPEGAHLRLDPSLDLSTLHLPPLALMMAEAAQRYGIFVRDVAANVTFYAQDPINIGRDPYRGPGGYFEGSYPQALLAAFPWESLQLLAADAGT
jgi:hypothetical protein